MKSAPAPMRGVRRLRMDLLGGILLAGLFFGAEIAPVDRFTDKSGAESESHDSPVADAAMRGDAAAVQALLAEGADVNEPQGDGMTALHWAAHNRDASLARILIDAGADVAAGTRIGGYTPLHLAAQVGAGEVVEMLLGAGA
ncbi:MAG: ankyrin repeat domain-containing protein, partial [Gemmatimonadetes bacterium]|nr:ankyrin repeat domain-containing protein [Gemmatimonadota bacterium]